MTQDPRAALAAQIAECDSAIECAATKARQQAHRREALRAQLAALDAEPEPDWEALTDFVALIQDANFTDQELGAWARCYGNQIGDAFKALTTLARVPVAPWPGEGVQVALANQVIGSATVGTLTADMFLDFFRRLRAHMTAGGEAKSGKQFAESAKCSGDGWVTWHGGECPVPAGTLIEGETYYRGLPVRGPAEVFDWESPTFIRRYRILPAGEQSA
jgi:hypothetical protein